jgi:hypothetical protein
MPPRVPNLPRKPFNFIVFDHAEKSGGNAFKSRRGRLFHVGVFAEAFNLSPHRQKNRRSLLRSPELGNGLSVFAERFEVANDGGNDFTVQARPRDRDFFVAESLSSPPSTSINFHRRSFRWAAALPGAALPQR